MKTSLLLVLLIALHLVASDINVTSPLNTCGGNCPSNNCEACPCGTKKVHQDAKTACTGFASWNQACCTCLANKVSTANLNYASENTDGSYAVGLWGINSKTGPSCAGSAGLCALSGNLACAVQQWKNGGGSFKLWSQCGECNAACCSPPNPATASNSGGNNGGNSGNTGATSYGGFTNADLQAAGGDGNVPLPQVVNVVYENKKD